MRFRRLTAVLLVALAFLLAARALHAQSGQRAAAEERELQALLEGERAAADAARQRGDLRAARRTLDEHLGEDPEDAESRVLRAAVRRQAGDWEGALEDARRALTDARSGGAALRAECARQWAALELELGRPAEARDVLDGSRDDLDLEHDARSAWVAGCVDIEAGRVEEGREVLRRAMEGDPAPTWTRALARARCERRLGFLERASRSLVAAAGLPGERGEEPAPRADVLAELASVYFEADGEIEHAQARGRSPQSLYRKALELSPGHEAALVGLFAMQKVNWNLQQRSREDLLRELFAANPRSIAGKLAAAQADLEDGRLASARAALAELEDLAGGRRDVRSLRAAAHWIEHRREDAQALLDALGQQSPGDAEPWVTVGRTLNELYRFPEALPFLKTAVERDALDAAAWTQLGRSLANTGDSEGGSKALERAIELAAGRQDAWRHNTALALRRMLQRFVTVRAEGDLSFSWEPGASAVLSAYEIPFYQDARSELARRYGFTPEAVNVQVFDSFADFSVRSTGFEGFPALGVCFGPVVTAVSPASELRRKFSWARTGFHEFTHVIHLGLSHNRCPRWITEGLATWEEENKNPAWTRNMRRELIDAFANDDLIAVRDLNRAFRGPRILFGYYQGGLLCRMWIERSGFPPLIRLLEAFDRGEDLDTALRGVYGTTPEALDVEFRAFVERTIEGLAIEPRWNPATVAKLRVSLASEAPEESAAREAWSAGMATVAWGLWQAGRAVDAEQALRRLSLAGPLPARALFLQSEMALAQRDRARAAELARAGVAAGGRDFRARMLLGRLALQDGDVPVAEEHFRAAEALFPGYPEKELAAELGLAEAYAKEKRTDDMQAARERWLAWNSDEYDMRLELARWQVREGRSDRALRWFDECNQIDPFERALHVEWGEALEATGQLETALREYRVALLVPPELEPGRAGAPTDAERAAILARQARVELALGRSEDAVRDARAAIELDPACDAARAVLERGS